MHNIGVSEIIMHTTQNLWWPICLSDSVSSTKPIDAQLGDTNLALYRDGSNTVRAVEDRCPHRRAPLSLGRVTAEGNIQCGYHGWTFNGANGEICGFPNLNEGERLPKCSIKTYPIRESGGVVYLGNGQENNQPHSVTRYGNRPTGGQVFHGKAVQGLIHQECVAAFLDSPSHFLDIAGIKCADKLYGDPAIEQDLLVAERAAWWNPLGTAKFYLGPLRHRADFPVRIQTITAPVTGETLVQISRGESQLLAEVLITFTPAMRAMTAIHWRATVFPDAWGWLMPIIRLSTLLGISPIKMRSTTNCFTLSKELPTVGAVWRSCCLPEPTQVQPCATGTN